MCLIRAMPFLPEITAVPVIARTRRVKDGPRTPRGCGFRSVGAFPAGVRDVDDDAVGAGPFHLEIGVAAGRHRPVDMVLCGKPLAVCALELLTGRVEIVDLEAEMMDAGEMR